jgi:hypothetical protein
VLTPATPLHAAGRTLAECAGTPPENRVLSRCRAEDAEPGASTTELESLRHALAEASTRARASDEAAEAANDRAHILSIMCGVLTADKSVLLDYVEDLHRQQQEQQEQQERHTALEARPPEEQLALPPPKAAAAGAVSPTLVASLRANVTLLREQLAESRRAEAHAVAVAARSEAQAIALAAELAAQRRALDAIVAAQRRSERAPYAGYARLQSGTTFEFEF